MDCVLSSQNASAVDRMLQAVRAPMVSIETRNRVLLQAVAADRTLVLDLTLEESFFRTITPKCMTVTIPRQRFYMKKMKLLRITTNEYVVVFEYVFDGYVLRRSVFYNSPPLFAVCFKADCSGEVSLSTMGAASKEIGDGLIVLQVANGVGEIRGEGAWMRFPLGLDAEFSAEVMGSSLKGIFEVSDLFDQAIVIHGSSNSSINFVLTGQEARASFFLAANYRRE